MHLVDDVLVTAGVLWLVVRQFRWRDAAGMPRTAIVLAALGAVLALQSQLLGPRWTAVDLLAVGAEVVLAAALGAVMGGRYRLRREGGRTLARLQGTGVALWAVFVVLRLTTVLTAEALGARAAASAGGLLLVFAANRAATAWIVARRLRADGPALAGLPARPLDGAR